MSDPVTALDGQSITGQITIADAGPTGMVTLRANFASATVMTGLVDVGLVVPDANQIASGDGTTTLWMSPDEVMILCDYDDAEAQAQSLGDALASAHALAINVSDARCVFRLTGQGGAIRDVLAKLSPADLRPSALPVGMVRRTRLAQVPVAFWFSSDTDATLICFRSVGGYVFDLLSKVSEPGSAVGYFG